MFIVKITILLAIITLIYAFAGKIYAFQNPKEALKMALNRTYLPKWLYPLGVLIWIDVIGILVSTVYLLFFR